MQMRYFITSALLCLLLCGCSLRKQKESNYYEEESKIFEEEISYESIEEAEQKILDIFSSRYGDPYEDYIRELYCPELATLILNDPATLDYPFEELQEKGYIDVVTSDDGNLRIYYWDTGTGGTYIQWMNICQYRCNGKVYAFHGSMSEMLTKDEEPDGESVGDGCAVMKIITICKSDNTPIYLVHNYVRAASNWGYGEIEAIEIKDGELVAAPIFRGGLGEYYEDKQYSRGVEYTIADWYFRANRGEGWEWLFKYDTKSNSLYVPEADPSLSDRYSIYRFDGEKLNFIGIDGGFWLHPTIRSFESMEEVFETKDYRVRIDKMTDGTFRYSAWNNRATMDKAPDIIIYSGSYNQEEERFYFKNGNVTYTIDSEGPLTVTRNGKKLLQQERLKNS